MDSDTSPSSAPRSEDQELARAALNCYLSALLAVGQSAADICPHIGAHFQTGILRSRQRLAFETTPKTLAESLSALQNDFALFSRRVGEYYSHKVGDVAAILDVVSQAVETFEARDQLYLERLGLVVRQLESGLSSEDPAAMRAAYERQLEHLRKFLDHLMEEGRSAFDQLRADIGSIEERLLEAEAQAAIDPLTALVNRRELERLIRDRVPEEKPFCLLLFDIRGLRVVNDRYGQDAGDQILKQFGARLAAQVRPRDIVARWGGDEFAVIFDCPAATADPRAQQIAQWISGRYPIVVNGQDWKADIEASVAVVEHQPGEPDTAFVTRASSHIVQQFGEPVDVPAGVAPVAESSWRTM